MTAGLAGGAPANARRVRPWRRHFRNVLLLGVFASGSGVAQAAPAAPKPPIDIPQSHDPGWAVMRKVQIRADYNQGVYVATFPAEVKGLAGKQLSITGYMLPVDVSPRSDHFILSRYSPTCPFCPPGEPNEHIEVFTTKPVALSISLITVKGRFAIQNDQSQGLFLVLNNAKVN